MRCAGTDDSFESGGESKRLGEGITQNRNDRRREGMEQLTQTISNLVGILLGVVGAVGVGFFVYEAYLYLTASGARSRRGSR